MMEKVNCSFVRRFKLEEDVLLIALPLLYSLGVDVDDDNRKLFEDFEKNFKVD